MRGLHTCKGAALQDGAAEETLGQRGNAEGIDADGAGRFAYDGDVVRIASECRYVALYPLQGCNLVEKSVVACRAVGG